MTQAQTPFPYSIDGLDPASGLRRMESDIELYAALLRDFVATEKDAAQAIAEQLSTLLAHLPAALKGVDQQIAEQLLATATEIANQVVRQTLQLKPEMILPVVREAIGSLNVLNGHPALFLHPDDAQLVRQRIGDQLTHNNWRIIEDAGLTRGGCRVEMGASEVDATVETRWRRVIEAMGINAEWLAEHSEKS